MRVLRQKETVDSFTRAESKENEIEEKESTKEVLRVWCRVEAKA